MVAKYNITKEIFSKRLRELMQNNNETTYSMAEQLHLSAATISRYTDGQMAPKITTIESMARYFNINPAWLMGYDVEKELVLNESSETKKLSKEETILLENFNKLNNLGKEEANKRVSELTEINKYINTSDEISATKDNVIVLNSKEYKEVEEKFIPYKSLDEAGTTIAAHDDDLTEEEKKLADKILLDYINNERLKEFNKKHNIK